MWRLILLGFFVSVLVISCGTINVNTNDQAWDVAYKDLTFNEVWDASILTIQDIRFTVIMVDKDSGIIYADQRGVEINVMIREVGETVLIRILDPTVFRKVARSFIEALNNRLGMSN